MKWTRPEYNQILLLAFPRYQAAKDDARDNIVQETRREIKDTAKENDFAAPTGLTEVSLKMIVFQLIV